MQKVAGAALLAVFTLATTPALADTNDDGWDVTLMPYVWAAGIDGSVAHPALDTPITAKASFGDVLDQLDVGGMVTLEARKGRVGLIAEVFHIRMSDTASIPAVGLPVDLSTRTTTSLVAGEVRVLDTDAASIDALAGARYWSVSTRVQYTIPDTVPLPAPLPRTYEARKGAEWVDAMMGLKARANLSSKIHATATGMLGFGGSHLVTDISLLVGVDISPRTNLTLGYRCIDVDYSSGYFTYNAKTHGPLVGVGIRF